MGENLSNWQKNLMTSLSFRCMTSSSFCGIATARKLEGLSCFFVFLMD